MYDFVEQTGLNIADEQDVQNVQKAYELIDKNLN